MAQNTVYALLFILTVLPYEGLCASECRTKTYEETGDVKFSLILSMHANGGQGTCGKVGYAPLQLLAAVRYVLKKLNTEDKNGDTFVPGIKLGVEVYDDCGNEEYAISHAQDSIRLQFPGDIVECNASTNISVFAGFIGPSRSQSTAAVSEILWNTEIPLVTMGATLSELSNKTIYPNVLRTTVSDSIQSRAIVSLLKTLGWTFVAIVHTTDNYGTDLAESIQKLAKTEQICVIDVLEVTTQTEIIERVLTKLLQKQKQTVGNNMGVIYVGQWDVAKLLMRSVQTQSPNEDERLNLKWIMSDGVGTNPEVMPNFDNFVLTVSPKSTPLLEFGEFFQSEMNAHKTNSMNATNPWLTDYVQTRCRSGLIRNGCDQFEQSDYVVATIDAAYAMSAAVKSAHREICKGVKGMCRAFRDANPLNILRYIRNVSLDYATLDENHAVREFSGNNRRIEFDVNGDIKRVEGRDLYDINTYRAGAFHKVGSFHHNGTWLAPNFVQQASQSNCKEVCNECIDEPSFVYLPGDILLAGFYSMHWFPTVDNPFGCGKFRDVAHTVIAVEAFMYMVKKLSENSRWNFGAIVFDECYSSLRAELFVSKYFSGEIPLIDPRTGKKIDLTRVVAGIGCESSPVTMPLAESFRRMRLPVISPISTSPDLDDRRLYPYFLRTIPSDRGMGKVMVAFLKRFRWTYISILYSDNNYGIKAMQIIKESAEEDGICVVETISMAISPDEREMVDITKRLGKNDVRVVLFVGLDAQAKELQKVLIGKEIDIVFLGLEDWAVILEPVPGTERAVAGSVVFRSDAPKTPANNFKEHLLKITPQNKTSHWFDKFWQFHFKCDLPGRFENKYHRVCDPRERLKPTTAEEWSRQFRVGHTINAVASAINGATRAREFLCKNEKEFACETYKKHPEEVTAYIKNITLGTDSHKFRPFRDDGNGNIGFQIHNLQRLGDGTYKYIEIGNYDSVLNELTLIRESVFYSKGEPTEVVEADCAKHAVCTVCRRTAAPVMAAQDCALSPAVQDLVVLIVVCVICLLVVILLIIVVYILCRRRRDRVKRAPTVHGPTGRNPEPPPRTIEGTQTHDLNLTTLNGPSFVNEPATYNSSNVSQFNSMETTAFEENIQLEVQRMPEPSQPPERPLISNTNSWNPSSTGRPVYDNQPSSYNSSAASQVNSMESIVHDIASTSETSSTGNNGLVGGPMRMEYLTNPNPPQTSSPEEQNELNITLGTDAPPLPCKSKNKTSSPGSGNSFELDINPLGSSVKTFNDPHQASPKVTSDPHQTSPEVTGDPHQTSPKVTGDPHPTSPKVTGGPHPTSLRVTGDPHQTSPKVIGDPHQTSPKLTGDPHHNSSKAIGDTHQTYPTSDTHRTSPMTIGDPSTITSKVTGDPRNEIEPRYSKSQDIPVTNGYLSAVHISSAKEQVSNRNISSDQNPEKSLNSHQTPALRPARPPRRPLEFQEVSMDFRGVDEADA